MNIVGDNYKETLHSLLNSEFIPAGYTITKNIELDPVPESAKYQALNFSLNNKNIVYRKGKVTPDRPGAFLSVWQRPSSPSINKNKPIPLNSDELDFLFVHVQKQEHANTTSTIEAMDTPSGGVFIFPVSILIQKGIVSSTTKKGKTGFRVFPPWSQDRGVVATKVFSESGKKTQRWQLPYFVKIDENGLINPNDINGLLGSVK